MRSARDRMNLRVHTFGGAIWKYPKGAMIGAAVAGLPAAAFASVHSVAAAIVFGAAAALAGAHGGATMQESMAS